MQVLWGKIYIRSSPEADELMDCEMTTGKGAVVPKTKIYSKHVDKQEE